MKRLITMALLLGLALNSAGAAETGKAGKAAASKTTEAKAGIATAKHSCTDAPATAITKIPAPVNAYAAVRCFNVGHVIGSTEDMLWQFPNGSKAIFPAQNLNHDDIKKVDPNAHFIEITLSPPSREEGQDIVRNLASKGYFRDKYRHTLLFKLYARSSKGLVYTLYFANFSNNTKEVQEITGLACTPDCLTIQGKNSGTPFVVVYKNPPKPPQAKGGKSTTKPPAADKKAP